MSSLMANLAFRLSAGSFVPCGGLDASLDRGGLAVEWPIPFPAGYVRARRAGEAPVWMHRRTARWCRKVWKSAFFAHFLFAKRKWVARRGEIPARCREKQQNLAMSAQ